MHLNYGLFVVSYCWVISHQIRPIVFRVTPIEHNTTVGLNVKIPNLIVRFVQDNPLISGWMNISTNFVTCII